MTTIQIKGTEFKTPADAIQHADNDGDPIGSAIQIHGDGWLRKARYLVVPQAEADRLAAAGVEFAFLFDHGGRLVTVPVN